MQCDGVVDRASASQSVDLEFISLVIKRKVVENKQESSHVSFGKALSGTPPLLCGR